MIVLTPSFNFNSQPATTFLHHISQICTTHDDNTGGLPGIITTNYKYVSSVVRWFESALSTGKSKGNKNIIFPYNKFRKACIKTTVTLLRNR